MPAVIDRELCDGCGASPEPPCVRVCPGDVVVKDFVRGRSCLRDPGECWDCYACVKACPRNAIQVVLPYVLARRDGYLHLVEHGDRGVVWEIRWPDGTVQRVRRPAHLETFGEPERVAPDVYSGDGI